nr:biliverdin-producing heme oxygenase [Paracoccus saliphilus]
MQSWARRQILRTGTDVLHRRLDDQLGDLTRVQDYIRYLAGTFAFRCALEPALTTALADAGQAWRILPLSAALRADMRDIGHPLPVLPAVPDLTQRAGLAGALYVVEGSALGARLIASRAAALGFGTDHAARHLAQQTADKSRWRSFLTWLEEAPFDPHISVQTAQAVFHMAIEAHGPSQAAAADTANGHGG